MGRPSHRTQTAAPTSNASSPAWAWPAVQTAQPLALGVPVHLTLFDVLFLNGQDLTGRPWTERRQALTGLGLTGPARSVPAAVRDHAAAALDATRTAGTEGIVAQVQRGEADPALAQFGDHVDEVLEAAAVAVERGDHEGVAGAIRHRCVARRSRRSMFSRLRLSVGVWTTRRTPGWSLSSMPVARRLTSPIPVMS
jgi:ATP dependent DNA ligase domain